MSLLLFFLSTSFVFAQETYLGNFDGAITYGDNNGTLNFTLGWEENNEDTNPSSGPNNVGTGIWDLNTVILTFSQTATLVISAEITPAYGTIMNVAEIIDSGSTDTDSAPNNGG